MGKNHTQRPTDRELTILRVLWRNGSSTVRQVNEEMNREQRTGYTTTLKLMQIMTEKGLLVRDDSRFQHVFKPAVSEEKTQNLVVGDLLDKVFNGSAQKLVMRALSAQEVSGEELAQIRSLLDDLEGA